MEHITCPTCSADVEPRTPKRVKLVNVLMWICGLSLAVAASIPLLGIAVLPLWFFALWGLGVSSARSSMAACPVCGSPIARPSVEPAALHGPLVSQPA